MLVQGSSAAPHGQNRYQRWVRMPGQDAACLLPRTQAARRSGAPGAKPPQRRLMPCRTASRTRTPGTRTATVRPADWTSSSLTVLAIPLVNTFSGLPKPSAHVQKGSWRCPGPPDRLTFQRPPNRSPAHGGESASRVHGLRSLSSPRPHGIGDVRAAQAFSSASADPVSSNQTGVVILTIYNPHRG